MAVGRSRTARRGSWVSNHASAGSSMPNPPTNRRCFRDLSDAVRPRREPPPRGGLRRGADVRKARRARCAPPCSSADRGCGAEPPLGAKAVRGDLSCLRRDLDSSRLRWCGCANIGAKSRVTDLTMKLASPSDSSQSLPRHRDSCTSRPRDRRWLQLDTTDCRRRRHLRAQREHRSVDYRAPLSLCTVTAESQSSDLTARRHISRTT